MAAQCTPANLPEDKLAQVLANMCTTLRGLDQRAFWHSASPWQDVAQTLSSLCNFSPTLAEPLAPHIKWILGKVVEASPALEAFHVGRIAVAAAHPAVQHAAALAWASDVLGAILDEPGAVEPTTWGLMAQVADAQALMPKPDGALVAQLLQRAIADKPQGEVRLAA